MLSVDSSHRGFIRVRAQGVLDAGDYRLFAPAFAAELKETGRPAPLLLDLRGFRGWTPAGFLADLRFDLLHRRAFSRIAVLGDRRWQAWTTWAAAALFTARLRFFRPEEEPQAEAWLRRGGAQRAWD